MKLVSPVLESIEGAVARSRTLLDGVPQDARMFARVGKELPGIEADPVFIIPGLTADRWMYGPGTRMLRDEGFEVGGMQMPWHGWSGIPSDARKMREAVERTIDDAQRAGRDVDRVQIVGDSEGGLIGRWFLQFEGGQDLVSRYVSNGTPHGAIRPFGSDAVSSAVQRMPFMPAGVRDLLTSSSVMRDLNADLPAYLQRAHAADPDFRMHAIASRLFGQVRHDGLVPEHAARLPGAEPMVTNYVTSGTHSINFSRGRRHAEGTEIMLAALGSRDPQAVLAAERGRDVARAAAAVQP
ncbi:MAG: lipase class 2 [Thermoleophilia bacterium]|nr:lipase class 2 [Thermoleophilia bacterium]